jgi:hypothetical protein
MPLRWRGSRDFGGNLDIAQEFNACPSRLPAEFAKLVERGADFLEMGDLSEVIRLAGFRQD